MVGARRAAGVVDLLTAAVAEVHDGHVTLRWITGDVVDGDDEHPRLRVVATVEV